MHTGQLISGTSREIGGAVKFTPRSKVSAVLVTERDQARLY